MIDQKKKDLRIVSKGQEESNQRRNMTLFLLNLWETQSEKLRAVCPEETVEHEKLAHSAVQAFSNEARLVDIEFMEPTLRGYWQEAIGDIKNINRDGKDLRYVRTERRAAVARRREHGTTYSSNGRGTLRTLF